MFDRSLTASDAGKQVVVHLRLLMFLQADQPHYRQEPFRMRLGYKNIIYLEDFPSAKNYLILSPRTN